MTDQDLIKHTVEVMGWEIIDIQDKSRRLRLSPETVFASENEGQYSICVRKDCGHLWPARHLGTKSIWNPLEDANQAIQLVWVVVNRLRRDNPITRVVWSVHSAGVGLSNATITMGCEEFTATHKSFARALTLCCLKALGVEGVE